MIYWASADGASDADIQKRNLDFAARELAKCRPRGEPFVYVAPAHVMFDMSVAGRRYTESSDPEPVCYAGEVCRVMEERVMAYEHGYTVRTLPLIDTGPVLAALDWMRHGYYEGQKIFDSSFQFSSRQAIEDLANDIVHIHHDRRPRIQHVFSGIRFTASYIAFVVLGEEHGIEFDPNGARVFPDLQASLWSENFENECTHLQTMSQWIYRIGERRLENMKCPKLTE